MRIVFLCIATLALCIAGYASEHDPLALVPANARATLYYILPVRQIAVDSQTGYYIDPVELKVT
jgi:hypothetical protein